MSVPPRKTYPMSKTERTRVITIRLPTSLHDRAKREAHEKYTSLNAWCISKLFPDLPPPALPAATVVTPPVPV